MYAFLDAPWRPSGADELLNADNADTLPSPKCISILIDLCVTLKNWEWPGDEASCQVFHKHAWFWP